MHAIHKALIFGVPMKYTVSNQIFFKLVTPHCFARKSGGPQIRTHFQVPRKLWIDPVGGGEDS